MEAIEKVTEADISKFISLWCDGALSRSCLKAVRWYAVKNDKSAVALDNTKGDCLIEDFRSEEEAVKWLEDRSLIAADGKAVKEEQ